MRTCSFTQRLVIAYCEKSGSSIRASIRASIRGCSSACISSLDSSRRLLPFFPLPLCVCVCVSFSFFRAILLLLHHHLLLKSLCTSFRALLRTRFRTRLRTRLRTSLRTKSSSNAKYALSLWLPLRMRRDRRQEEDSSLSTARSFSAYPYSALCIPYLFCALSMMMCF